MIDARVRQLRREVRQGELPEDLVAELGLIVRRLIRLHALPTSFSPYGQWDEEAASEIFNSWYVERLLARGHLQALLDRSNSVGSFRRLCERSLRQHILNSQDRSQARNLFRRLVGTLEEDGSFMLVRDAARPQDRWYSLSNDVASQEFSGEDTVLIAHGWAIGDLTIVRYRAGARKLSPVLDGAELTRFTAGLMERVACSLTPNLIMRALAARLDLGEVRVEALDEAPEPAAPRDRLPAIDEQLALRETALAVLGELTSRQVLVFQGTAEELTVSEIASACRCSVGTVVNERRRIAALVSRVSENDVERDQLLNILGDLVYSDTDE
jgi:hypothetical protein